MPRPAEQRSAYRANSGRHLSLPITRGAGGIIADTAGIETGFYVLGGVLLAMTLGLGLVTRLSPDDGS